MLLCEWLGQLELTGRQATMMAGDALRKEMPVLHNSYAAAV
jgi:hypothetical protein